MNQEAFDQGFDPTAGDNAAEPQEGTTGIESSRGDIGVASQQAKVNLDDLPEFRSYKATMESKLAKQRKEYEAAQAREAEWQKRLDQVEQRLADKMPPAERSEWERQKLERERDQWRNGYSQVVEHLNRVSQVEELSREYGVDAVELLEATEPVQAFEKIAAKQRQRIEEMNSEMDKLRKQLQAREAAGDEIVDLGAGTAQTAGSALQKQYNEAAKRSDVSTMDKIVLEAARRGVKLDRFSVFM